MVLAAIVAQKHTDKRHREDIELQYKKEIEAMAKKHEDDLKAIQKDYQKNFEEIKNAMSDLRAVFQQAQAITEIKIENLTNEVREHNNFAKRMPVVEEQIKVANHRIDDLERNTK